MIDPAKHVAQIRAVGAAEAICPGCGKRTRDALGFHGRCRRARSIVTDLPSMADDQVAAILVACRTELKTRRDALTQTLEET